MVYIILFSTLIIGVITYTKNKPTGFLFFVITILWLIIGMRDISVGPDTESYVSDFNGLSRWYLNDLSLQLPGAKEPLYLLVTWFCSCFSSSYTFFLLIWALFPAVSLFIVFKQYLNTTKDYMVAVLAFFLLGLFAFYVAGIRQTAALSLILIGFKYFMAIDYKKTFRLHPDKNVFAFALIMILAYMVHNSSILFLVAFFVRDIKVRWWYIIIAISLFFIGQYVQIDDIVLLSRIFFEDRFATYGSVYESSQNDSAFIMQIILFILCFALKNKMTEDEKTNNALFNFVMLGVVFQSLSGALAEMARVSFYFSMFYMLLVPRAFQALPSKFRNLCYFGFITVALIYLYFLSSTNLPIYKMS